MSIDDRSLENMNLEDMNKEQRQQCADKYNRERREWVEKVPSAAPLTHLPNEAEVRRQLKESEESLQRSLQQWIEKGGSPKDYD